MRIALRQVWIWKILIVDPEEYADGKKSHDNRNVCQTRQDESQSTASRIFSGEHPLNHILICAVGGHGNERGRKKSGPEGVFAFEDSFDLVEKVALIRWAKAPKREFARLS